ncbi:hypothetical protein [Bradyrhizobium sp. CCBAU 45394]|uniref:hypothetical protein n=1 Tax=Bradyrhizobium sp. CCBAU 45394 TaxID=1325087 RepID=UPI003FA42E53
MFESLLPTQAAYHRHCDAPFAVERARYLRHCLIFPEEMDRVKLLLARSRRADITDGGVAPLSIVEAFDVSNDITSGVLTVANCW